MTNVLRGIAVGVDLEDIERFRIDFKKKKNFLEKIFTAQELKYCFTKSDPAPHLAARFAGKEAVYKALFSMRRKGVDFKDIEIRKESVGAPEVRLKGKSLRLYTIALSISHTKNTAAAFAIIYS